MSRFQSAARFILFITIAVVLPAASGAEDIPARYDLRALGKVEVTKQILFGSTASWITLTAQDEEHAAMIASKWLADLKGFGDVCVVPGPATNITLKGEGGWIVGTTGGRVEILFARDTAELAKLAEQAESSAWKPVAERVYPRWLDRFDNDALSMGFLGFGALPKDIDDEIRWMGEKRLNIAGNCYYKQDMMVAPGVFDFTIPDYYAALTRKHDLAFVPYTNWAEPWRPTWLWNRIPLPHIIPEDGTFVAHNRIAEQKLAAYSEFEPLQQTDVITAAAYRAQAAHFAAIPQCNMQFGFAEVGRLSTLSLSAIAGSPEVTRAWHAYLQDTMGYDLARAGTLYRGDPTAYAGWDQLALPTMKTFAGWNPATCLDLRGLWSVRPGKIDIQAVSTGTMTDGWTELRPDDPIILLYAGRHGDKQESEFWMTRTFSLRSQEFPQRRFLHLSRNNWHGNISPACTVYINGKQLKNISDLHPTTFDCDLCYDVADALQEGENRILINTKGLPVPGYLFLGPSGPWKYPGPDPYLNRLFFDVTEFAAHYRMKGVEGVLKALRSGDPQGRPLQVMAPWEFVDLTFDLFRKYGAYAHDTGLGGSCWAPWMHRYYATRGMPFSSEPGGPPATVEEMRRMITLWTMLGDDAVNLLFDPGQYHYRDKNSVGGWIDNNAQLLRCLGKMEIGQADVGVLRSVRNASRLRLAIPWWMDISRGDLQSVGRTVNLLDPSDLEHDRADGWFKVIFDAGSEVLTEGEIAGIERYVRNGGIFVAFEHTGRHSPEKAQSWPISHLSGLNVVQREGIAGAIRFSADQTLWPSLRGKELQVSGRVYDFRKTEFTGDSLGMERVAGDVEVIAQWPGRSAGQGQIAVAQRKLGKGRIITIGANFWRESQDEGGRFSLTAGSRPYLDELLNSLNVPAGSVRDLRAPGTGGIFAEQWVSKNGLYDLFLIARVHAVGNTEEQYRIGFRAPQTPTRLIEISAEGHPEVVCRDEDDGFTLDRVGLLPMQLRIFASARNDIALAPLHWLQSLQKRWYALPEMPQPQATISTDTEEDANVLALNTEWLLCAGGQRWGAHPPQDFDWSKGRTVRPGAFASMGLENDALVHMRKEFRLPSAWKGKRVKLSFAAVYWHWGIFPNGRLWVNGKPAPIEQPLHYRANGSFMFDLPDNDRVVMELEIDGALKPGENRPRPSGVTGVFFAEAQPQPVRVDSLNGTWLAALDVTTAAPAKTGERARYVYLEKKFRLPAKNAWPSGRPFLESPAHLGWVILNGRVVSTPGHMNRLNVSGLLRAAGEENVLRWVPCNLESPGIGRAQELAIPSLCIAWWPDETSGAERGSDTAVKE